MAGWRVGVAIKPEQQFGKEDTSATWHYVGVGMDFTITENNNWSFQKGMGSKTPQLQFEGKFTATWTGNLYLDYNNFYWLLFGLEEYAFNTESRSGGKTIGVHVFTTSNKKSLKSFSMRFLKLDETVGGPFDENITLLGCTMDKVNPQYEAGTSSVKVAIGGKFADTVLKAVQLTDTVDADVINSQNTIRPLEWGCLQLLNEVGTAWEKVATNEKTGFTFSRTVSQIPDCGERISTGFYESSISEISIDAQVYSRNPNQWQTRMHTGGIKSDIGLEGNTQGLPNTSRPRRKGLEPIPNIRIASGSYTESVDETPDYTCYAEFEDCVVESWGNRYNATSEIVESPSLKAMRGRIIIKTPDVLLPVGSGDTAVKVTYDFDNGNTAELSSWYAPYDTVELITYNGTKDGYVLNGWVIEGQTNVYKGADSYKLSNTSVTFKANWVAVQNNSD